VSEGGIEGGVAKALPHVAHQYVLDRTSLGEEGSKLGAQLSGQ
jgi:hypothetical protein